jgi:hypothetical protein
LALILEQDCQTVREESRKHLLECQRLTSERSELRSELRLHLDELRRRETIMDETRRELQTERRRLWNTKKSVTCKRCK